MNIAEYCSNPSTNMIRLLYLFGFCLVVCGVYGQDWKIVKREPLSNGDVAVWARDTVWRRVVVYFQKEHEAYTEMYRYRDTAKTDDRSVWLMYQSLCKPGVRDAQQRLGNLLLSSMAPLVQDFLDVQFMLDQEGKIRAIGGFCGYNLDKLPSEVFLEVTRRMKAEIRYPSLKGKDYYPWGISVRLLPEELEKGYSFRSVVVREAVL